MSNTHFVDSDEYVEENLTVGTLCDQQLELPYNHDRQMYYEWVAVVFKPEEQVEFCPTCKLLAFQRLAERENEDS